MKYGLYLLTAIIATFLWINYTHKSDTLKPEATGQKVSTGTEKSKNNKQKPESSTTDSDTNSDYEEKVHTLFEKFVDTEKYPELSWKEFALQVSNLLEKEKKNAALAKKLKELSDSTTVWYISYQLLSYKNMLPEKTQKLFKQYSRSELLDRMSYRVKRQKA